MFVDSSGKKVKIERKLSEIERELHDLETMKLSQKANKFQTEFVEQLANSKKAELQRKAADLKLKLKEQRYDEISEESESNDSVDEDGNVKLTEKKKPVVALGSLAVDNRKVYTPDSQFVVERNEGGVQFPMVNFKSQLEKEIGGIQIDNQTHSALNIVAKLKSTQESLTNGLNLTKLKAKYKANEVTLQRRDYDLFKEENADGVFGQTAIAKADSDNEYIDEFEQEKLKDMEEDIPKQEKKMKGWGDWTGFGVQEKQIDHEKEQREHLARIVSS